MPTCPPNLSCSVLGELTRRFTESDVAMMLTLLNAVGLQLRGADPAAMKVGAGWLEWAEGGGLKGGCGTGKVGWLLGCRQLGLWRQPVPRTFAGNSMLYVSCAASQPRDPTAKPFVLLTAGAVCQC